MGRKKKKKKKNLIGNICIQNLCCRFHIQWYVQEGIVGIGIKSTELNK